MNKYRVQTGVMDVEIKADTHQMAAMKAIERYNPKSLGIIIMVLKDGDAIKDEMYMLTTNILKRMGYKIEI